MIKYFKLKNNINYNNFPYFFYKEKYELLLRNFYFSCYNFQIFYDKNEKKEYIILYTEQGNLKFLSKDIIQISKKEFKNLLFNSDNLLNKKVKLSNKINIEEFPYSNIPFFYIDIIKNQDILIIKKQIKILDKKYLLVRNISNKSFLKEDLLVKQEDLILI